MSPPPLAVMWRFQKLVDELGEVRRRRVSRGANHTDIITDIDFAVSYTRDAA